MLLLATGSNPWGYTIILACVFCLSACVSIEEPNVNEDFLKTASCQELQAEIVRVGAIQSDAEHEQGITGTQVAAGLLLGGLGTAVNHERATSAGKDAKAALKNIYKYWDRKNCSEERYRKNKG